MAKRIAAVAALLLMTACSQSPVQDEVTIDFSSQPGTVAVVAETRFELDPKSALDRSRVESARAAALSSTDPWSARFARVSPDEEQHSIRKRRGALESVTRSARVREDELQQIFSDTNITVNVTDGDGWRELAFYPGSSGRASREQHARFNATLAEWSTHVARYYAAVHQLYAYMDRNPQRAQFMFASLLDEKGADGFVPALGEEEQALVDRVLESMDTVATQMDAQESRALSLGEDADMIFNPFPARMVIRVRGDVISHEGFAKSNDELVIEPVDLFAAISSLEGRWITPDPLAALLKDESPSSTQLAAIERKSSLSIDARTIADAVRKQLTRAPSYVVRWRGN
jgi:hypothetical protein